MAKRSSFERRAADAYLTWDPRAVRPLLPHLPPGTRFCEPCVGRGDLAQQLVAAGHECVHASDIESGVDALSLGPLPAGVITNPPWSRPVLHAMISHWLQTAPFAWLLFDADWCHTKQSTLLMQNCSDIVAVGRVRWIEGTSTDGKDNCAWYRFAPDANQGPTRFHPRLGV